MKLKHTILILFIFSALITNSQNWLKNIPEKSTKDISFYDYQKAFNDYWEPYQIKNGKYTDDKGIEQKAYGWKQFKRWEYFWETRVDPVTGKFPKAKMYEEYHKYKTQLINTKAVYDWVSLGPNSSDGGYAGIGRISVVAFHPSDENTFWVGAPAGGLWLTTTGGNDWTPLNENNEVLGISAILIPSDFETSYTIYIGTGDRDAFDNNSIGVLKSTDAGVTWQTTGLVFDPATGDVVNSLLIHPTNDNIIFAATSDGFHITTDAGLNWTQTSVLEFIDVEFKPTDPSILYASTRGGRVYKSIDSGNNWTEVFNSGAGNRIELAVSLNAPDRLYIMAANSGQGLNGIYRSDDNGVTINSIYNSGSLLNWSTTGTGTNDGQAWYDMAFDSDPNNADVLYLGGVNTWKSVDGGYTWSLSNHWYGGGGVQDVHADKHFFKYRPGTSVLFECNDGGIYSTIDGNSWSDLSNGLVISQMYGMSTAQTVSNVTITGLQDNGTKAVYNGIWDDVIGGDGMKCLIDHQNAQTQYGSLYYGDIYRTNNAWGSSTNISNNIPGGAAGAWVTPYVLDPNDSETIYVGFNTLWKSENKGLTFESIGSFGSLKVITVAPSNSNVIYVSTGSTLHKTVNGGVSWISITNNLPTGTSLITDIAVKHSDASTIWVSLGAYNSDGVYESVDGGLNWTNISTGLPEIPCNTIIQNKFESAEKQLFVGTDFGVYIKNGTENWVIYGNGLPKTVVTEFDIYYDNAIPENSMLRASTYGRGLWEIQLDLSGNFAPYIQTAGISNVASNSATASGEIINTYGFDILESGIIVGTNPNPNIGDDGVLNFPTSPLVTTGTFLVDLTGLNPGTNYYYKAYAVNENGMGTGNVNTFNTFCTINTNVPYNQNFDNFGLIPNCWTEYVIPDHNINWQFGDMPVYHPYFGDYCAYISDFSSSDNKSQLIMPVSDFSSHSQLYLSFWHIQPPTFSFQDELKVLYKANLTDEWIVLKHYTEAVNEWTEKHVNLPNLSNTYYIAFEGNAKAGRGIGIDEISIQDGVNIQTLNDEKLIKVFPNPSKGIFNIEFNNSELTKTFLSIIVTDITGKETFSSKTELKNNQIQIDLTKLNKGVYFLNITFENKIISKKLVLN